MQTCCTNCHNKFLFFQAQNLAATIFKLQGQKLESDEKDEVNMICLNAQISCVLYFRSQILGTYTLPVDDAISWYL